MAPQTPKVTFNNGSTIPIIGLGTWKSQPGEVTEAVKEAIACGYRHLDCAKCYGNEAEVGAGIRAKIEDGTIKREDLFVTSKLWITKSRKDLVVPALKSQLKDLQLEYLDLYLVHWPVVLKEGDELFPRDSEGKIILGSNDYVDTWRGMEECVKQGLAKSIGVSNFNKRQLERLFKEVEIPPANIQIEVHPYLSQKKLIQFSRSKGLTITAYSPLGSPDRPAKDNNPSLLQDPTVTALAKKYNKDAGQILIRYQVENNTIVIPKSVTPSRIRSNLQVFDFSLTPAEMESLEALNKNLRYIPFALVADHPEYPFKEAY